MLTLAPLDAMIHLYSCPIWLCSNHTKRPYWPGVSFVIFFVLVKVNRAASVKANSFTFFESYAV